MIVYLDTSALVKLYVEEAFSAEVRAAVVSATAVNTHLIAYAVGVFDGRLAEAARGLGIVVLG